MTWPDDMKAAEMIDAPAMPPAQAGFGGASDKVVRDVTDAEIRSLVQDMNQGGVGILPNYIALDDLARLQARVQAAVLANDGEYTVFSGPKALPAPLLDRIVEADQFRSMMHRLHESGIGLPAPRQTILQVLRCLSGKSGQKHNYYFHFDSYAVTALLPILIPTEGRRGNLVMAPNIRNIRPFYIMNLLDKILLDNPITQQLLRFALQHRLLKFKKIEMVPGQLYLFWGYKSLHTNEACDPENVRATALFHFGDPHAASALRRRMGRVVS
jgi:hypothetical protein